MKNDIDYLNFEDLNEVETDIKTKTDLVKVTSTIPDYNKKDWVVDELPFVQEIDRIEKGIETLGEYVEKPYGWKTSKEWITPKNQYPLKSFDYNDYNRWINNLSLININEIPNNCYWNGNSIIEWNKKNNYEWEE